MQNFWSQRGEVVSGGAALPAASKTSETRQRFESGIERRKQLEEELEKARTEMYLKIQEKQALIEGGAEGAGWRLGLTFYNFRAFRDKKEAVEEIELI